jgi:hypothetical protein
MRAEALDGETGLQSTLTGSQRSRLRIDKRTGIVFSILSIRYGRPAGDECCARLKSRRPKESGFLSSCLVPN